MWTKEEEECALHKKKTENREERTEQREGVDHQVSAVWERG